MRWVASDQKSKCLDPIIGCAPKWAANTKCGAQFMCARRKLETVPRSDEHSCVFVDTLLTEAPSGLACDGEKYTR